MASEETLPANETESGVELIRENVESSANQKSKEPDFLKEKEGLNLNSYALQTVDEASSSVLPKEDDPNATALPKEEEDPKSSALPNEGGPNSSILQKEDNAPEHQDAVFKIPQILQRRTPIERPVEHIHFDKKWEAKRGSGGLAPSKSTVYIANLPFSLTNNDLHKILEKFGRCIKVSIPRDSEHRSKGIAFALFLEREPCIRVINTFHGKQLFGRTLKCSMAKDNGRTREFIRRKEYPNKSRCYECGEFGHLSYKCPHNVLGERRRPRKKKKKKSEKKEEEDNYFNPDISLAQAIAEDAEMADEEEGETHKNSCATADRNNREEPAVPPDPAVHIYEDQDGNRYQTRATEQYVSYQTLPQRLISRVSNVVSRKRYQQDSYFSDEEFLEED
ncbi:hypothetical protein ACHWQZ_G004315 [Mnemiopsis leidyi]